MQENKKTQLRLVHPPKRLRVCAEIFQRPSAQRMLFPVPRKDLLIFVHFPDVTEEEFRDTLRYACPSFVIELRSTPRFDIGDLNRRRAFKFFESQNTKYSDLTSSLMGKSDDGSVLSNLKDFLTKNKVSFDRPIVFLLNRREYGQDFIDKVRNTVSEFSSVGADVCDIPSFTLPNILQTSPH
jgi:hypothetical protein